MISTDAVLWLYGIITILLFLLNAKMTYKSDVGNVDPSHLSIFKY